MHGRSMTLFLKNSDSLWSIHNDTEAERDHCQQHMPFQWMPLLRSHSVIIPLRCYLHLLMACWEKKPLLHHLQTLFHSNPLDNGCHFLNHRLMRLMSGCVQHTSLFSTRFSKWQRHGSANAPLFVIFLFLATNCTSCTWEALMEVFYGTLFL